MQSVQTVRQRIRLQAEGFVLQKLVSHWEGARLWWSAAEKARRECCLLGPQEHAGGSRDLAWLHSEGARRGKNTQGIGFRRATLEPRRFNDADFKDKRSLAGLGECWQSSKVEKLCGELEALDLLVQAGAHVGGSAFDKVLRESIAQKNLVLGSRVHNLILRSGHSANAFLANHIICMYASHGRLGEATAAFAAVTSPNQHMWASIILAHARNGQPAKGIALYQEMKESNVKPNNHIFAATLKACASAQDLSFGRKVHADILGAGGKPDMVVRNCLVDMYAKCGSLEDASEIFHRMAARDVVTWNSLIKGYSQHGHKQDALILYARMRLEGKIVPNHITFICLLQACATAGDIVSGRNLHIEIQGRGLDSNTAVGNCLVNMYAKCGSLTDARAVFDNLPTRDVVTWNAIIRAYAHGGFPQEAIRLYESMQQEGITSGDAFTFASLLQACGLLAALEKGKEIHAQTTRLGPELTNLTVANALIAMYSSCESLEHARRVFNGLSIKDVVTWTAMIAGYSQNGFGLEALGLYASMKQEGISTADSITFVCVLQACSSLQDLDKGKEVHAEILINESLANDMFVGNALIGMYSKCGSLQDARQVFDDMQIKDVVTWTAIIAGYAQNGIGEEALSLYASMQQEGISPANHVTFVTLLQACGACGAGALHEGKLLHAKIKVSGLEEDPIVGTCLVDMYSKCGSVQDARKVFDNMPSRHVVTWNCMLTGYSQHGLYQEVIDMYGIMQEEETTKADSVTFVCLLHACAHMGALEKGKQIHVNISMLGLDMNNPILATALIDMYSKCGSLLDARMFFDNIPGKDLVTVTAIIAGYVQDGHGQEALDIYASMLRKGLAPAEATFVCLLQACASIGALDQGRRLHAQIVDRGLDLSGPVGNSLVKMYAKCGSLEVARKLFDNLPSRSVVTWNAMIAGYAQHGHIPEAFDLFRQMERTALADTVTFVCVLQACGIVAGLEKGREIHVQISKAGLDRSDLHVANSLIDMYGKCGSILEAKQVFDQLQVRDVVSWNALIAAHARQGDSDPVFDLLERMRIEGVQPNGVTFLSVISACGHMGLVGKGERYFESMSRDHNIIPAIEHYNCMVDLFARAGDLGKAMEMIKLMPFQPPAEVWTALLGACQKWRLVEVGRKAFEWAVNLGKDEAAAYVVMSNIYEAAQLWKEAQEIQSMRATARAWKQPGQSWWTDTNGVVHTFFAGKALLEGTHAYASLAHLSSFVKDETFVSSWTAHQTKSTKSHLPHPKNIEGQCEVVAQTYRLPKCKIL